MGLEGIVSKRVGSAYWSRGLPELDKGEEPQFYEARLPEKRGVNCGPAESIGARCRAKPHRERLFFAVAADADTTSADVIGSSQLRCG